MAATRLSDSQKQELVARFRAGEASGALAEAFGCSANTVSRVVRTALPPQEYEALKQQRGRSAGQVAAIGGGLNLDSPLVAPVSGLDKPATSLNPAAAATASSGGSQPTWPEPSIPEPPEPPAVEPSIAPGSLASGASEPGGSPNEPPFGAWVSQQLVGADQPGDPGLHPQRAGFVAEAAPGTALDPGSIDANSPAEDHEEDQGHAALAIDDADDFADEAGDEDSDDEGDGSDDADSFGGAYGGPIPGDGQTFVVLPLGQTIEDRPSLSVKPLEPSALPASVYMLVDKTVELDIKPLKDLPDLGPLPDGEGERHALVVYANPRQAKRYCGRNQRVIKVPDSGMLARTAPYLLSQGVTRLVVEGALYSLPGS